MLQKMKKRKKAKATTIKITGYYALRFQNAQAAISILRRKIIMIMIMVIITIKIIIRVAENCPNARS